MSSGGDNIRMCGFSAFLRCGIQYFDTMKVPRVLMPIIRSNRLMSVAWESVRLMALALLTQISMPPNSATVLSTAALTSSAAVKMVPLSFGCGSAVFAAIATLAPSRAARSAIASPMPRLAPEINSVLPLSDDIRGLHAAAVAASILQYGECRQTSLSAHLTRGFWPFRDLWVGRTSALRANSCPPRLDVGSRANTFPNRTDLSPWPGIDYGRTQPTRNPFYQCAQIHRDANPRAPASRESSGLVVDGLQAIDRRRDALVACFQLQGKELRVMARLMQIAAVEPQAFLLRRLPHVALFAFPWAGVLGRVRAEPPDLADLVGRVPADEVGHKAVHRAVAGRMDDYIGGQFLAIVDPDAVRRDFLDLTCGQLDLAVDDEVRGADIDVIAGAAPQIFHEQPGIIVAEIEPETGFR